MGAGRERVHRWWHTKQLADNRVIMGKPSVLFRKVVNTRVGDEIIAVNAQQYAVLVMDVPDLHKESRKCASPTLLCQVAIPEAACGSTDGLCLWRLREAPVETPLLGRSSMLVEVTACMCRAPCADMCLDLESVCEGLRSCAG